MSDNNDLIKYKDEGFFSQIKAFFKYIFSPKTKKEVKKDDNNIELKDTKKTINVEYAEDELSKDDIEKLYVLYRNNKVSEKELTRGQIYDLLDVYDEKIEEKKKKLKVNV